MFDIFSIMFVAIPSITLYATSITLYTLAITLYTTSISFNIPFITIPPLPSPSREFRDLQQGQRYLQDLVERQGIPVFHNIQQAVQCSVTILRKNLRPQDLTAQDSAAPVKMAYLQIGDKLM